MKYYFLQILSLATLTVGTTGIFFPTANLGAGQIDGDQQWQDFDKYDDTFDDKYSYQNPTYQQPSYQQYVDFQHQTYHHSASGSLRPSQTLLQSTHHLFQPVQHIYTNQPPPLPPHQQQQHQQPENLFQPIQLIPPYQMMNRYQNSPIPSQNNVPIFVRLIENQSIPPLRSVYTLPPFLEKLVERVQGYYSIYNSPEQLTLDRPLFRPTESTSVTEINISDSTKVVENIESTTNSVIQTEEPSSTTDLQQFKSSTTTAKPDTTTAKPKITPTTIKSSSKISTLSIIEITPTTMISNDNATESIQDITTEGQSEQTTDPSNFITPDTMRPDMKI